MATPWGVELHEDVLVIIDHKVLEGVGNDNSHGTLLAFGDRLRLDAGLNFAAKDIFHELTNILLSNLLRLVVRVLFIVDCVLYCEGREFFRFKVEICSMGAKGFGVNSRDIDAAFQLLSDRLQRRSKLCAFFRSFGKNICKGNTGLVRVIIVTNLPEDMLIRTKG